MNHARTLLLAVLALLGVGCRDVDDLTDELNGELIVTHVELGDLITVELGADTFQASPTASEDSVTFRFQLDVGVYTGEVRVEPPVGEALCAPFAVVIDDDGDRDTASVDARDMDPCDGGEGEGEGEEGEGEGEEGEGEGEEGEGEGEEGEGEGEGEGEPPSCVPGDPCDDGVDCTRDDRCQPTGVCLGVLSDAASCTCRAGPCQPDDACCLVPDDCQSGDGVCISECTDGSCSCQDALCAAALTGETLTCEDEATCRVDIGGADPSSFRCRSQSSCEADVSGALLAQVDCEDARCHVDADDAGFLGVDCHLTSACDVEAQQVGEVHLSCEEASCALDCRGGTCELDCGDGGDCSLQCADTDECSLSCSADSVACELDCEAAAPVACTPGTTCTCPVG